MAQIKTVYFSFPTLASLGGSGTLTQFTQITLYLPENSKIFHSVIARFSMDDSGNTGTNIGTKTLSLRLGASAYTTISNANAINNSGENISLAWVQDFTTLFNTSWTGTSMTCDAQATFQGSTTLVNASLTLEITYEYDETSTTQIKSVHIPLNAPFGALGTVLTNLAGVTISGTAGQFTCTSTTLTVGSFIRISGTFGGTGSITGYSGDNFYRISVTNGTTTFTLVQIDGTALVTTAGTPTGLTYSHGCYDVIPNLSTYLPEASKTFRNIYVQLQGNEARNAATTSHTITLNVGTAQVTTGSYSGTQASDRFFRYIWNVTSAYPSTSATQEFRAAASVSRVNHFQAYLVVTYEYSETSTTSVMNSVILPFNLPAPMGGTTSADYQSGTVELNVQEPNPAANRCAAYCFWTQAAAISTLNMRVNGNTSFYSYTDTASVMCGINGAMVRNDYDFIVSAGKNSYKFDIWRSDTADYGWTTSGFFILNYTSDKSTLGTSAHNKTVLFDISSGMGTAAAASTRTITAAAVPMTNVSLYWLSSIGVEYVKMTALAAPFTMGHTVQVEIPSADPGGIHWVDAINQVVNTDLEVGAYYHYGELLDTGFFKQNPTDPRLVGIGTDYAYGVRSDITSARRWRTHQGNVDTTFDNLTLMLTYNSIYYNLQVSTFDTGGEGYVAKFYDFDGNYVYGYGSTGDNTATVYVYDKISEYYGLGYTTTTFKAATANLIPSLGITAGTPYTVNLYFKTADSNATGGSSATYYAYI